MIDTDNWEIDSFYGENKSLFDGISDLEKSDITTIFNYLENNNLQKAIEDFNDILSSNSSDKLKTISNYGLGKAYAKKNSSLEDIDKSIDHLETALHKIRHADIYIMLGRTLKNKVDYISAQEYFDKDKLTELTTRAVSNFKRAASLDSSYVHEAEEMIALSKMEY